MAWVATWKPAAARGVGEREHLGIGMELQPARVGLVGIRLLQPGAARAERAVGEQLDARPRAAGRRTATASGWGTAAIDSVPGEIDSSGGRSAALLRPPGETTAQSAIEVLIDPTPVTPKPSRMSCDLSSACVDLGLAAAWGSPCRSVRARRRRTGRRGSRRPAGGLVAAVTPAAFIAAVLATTAWPSTRSSTTGRSRHDGVEVGGGREAFVGPEFLVPAETR